MKRLLRKLEEILWPRGVKCLCCDAPGEGNLLCPLCRQGLREMRLSDADSGNAMTCSVYRYQGVAKQLVTLLKYQCTADAADVLAEDMAVWIRSMHLPEDTVLTWVTMPEQRKRTRGIDHGQTLCKAVAARTGMPIQQMLTRCGKVHTQQGLNRAERMQNLPGTMRCTERLSGPVLLIDDVMTTGATAEVCRNLLTAAGASSVYVVTATRAVVNQDVQKG